MLQVRLRVAAGLAVSELRPEVRRFFAAGPGSLGSGFAFIRPRKLPWPPWPRLPLLPLLALGTGAPACASDAADAAAAGGAGCSCTLPSLVHASIKEL